MNPSFPNRIKKSSTFIFLVICLFNCKPHSSEWENANIDPNISKNSIYAQLNQEREILSFMEADDPLKKRSSDVSYSCGKKTSSGDDEYNPKDNNCRARFYDQDTLELRIGTGNMESGHGFTIQYKNGKFHVEPYYYNRENIEDTIKPSYKIIYQKLTLDKSTYKDGDSLYGYIDFKSIETNKNKEEHFGKGSFRAKIKEVSY